jgi:HAD superfamily hydrolase (TIGR01549 family)
LIVGDSSGWDLNTLNIQAVLFDLGGTLMYFDGDFSERIVRSDEVMLEALLTNGFELGADFLNDFRDSMESYYAGRDLDMIECTTASILEETLQSHCDKPIEDRHIRAALEARYSVTQKLWLLEDEASFVLNELRRRGLRMGVLSNAGDDEDVQTLVKNAGIRHCFDFVLSSAALGMRKPHPKAFKAALTRWRFPAADVLMVGDTLGADILGAQKCGMPNVWITRRADEFANREFVASVHPDFIFESLEELLSILD